MLVEEAIEILKEIIELHEDNCYLSTEDDFKAIKTLIEAYEKQSKEIEELNDKIKSKIEELDIEIQCCEYADDDLEEYKQDVEKEKARLLRDKAILQSLLEKE